MRLYCLYSVYSVYSSVLGTLLYSVHSQSCTILLQYTTTAENEVHKNAMQNELVGGVKRSRQTDFIQQLSLITHPCSTCSKLYNVLSCTNKRCTIYKHYDNILVLCLVHCTNCCTLTKQTLYITSLFYTYSVQAANTQYIVQYTSTHPCSSTLYNVLVLYFLL